MDLLKKYLPRNLFRFLEFILAQILVLLVVVPFFFIFFYMFWNSLKPDYLFLNQKHGFLSQCGQTIPMCLNIVIY